MPKKIDLINFDYAQKLFHIQKMKDSVIKGELYINAHDLLLFFKDIEKFSKSIKRLELIQQLIDNLETHITGALDDKKIEKNQNKIIIYPMKIAPKLYEKILLLVKEPHPLNSQKKNWWYAGYYSEQERCWLLCTVPKLRVKPLGWIKLPDVKNKTKLKKPKVVIYE